MMMYPLLSDWYHFHNHWTEVEANMEAISHHHMWLLPPLGLILMILMMMMMPFFIHRVLFLLWNNNNNNRIVNVLLIYKHYCPLYRFLFRTTGTAVDSRGTTTTPSGKHDEDEPNSSNSTTTSSQYWDRYSSCPKRRARWEHCRKRCAQRHRRRHRYNTTTTTTTLSSTNENNNDNNDDYGANCISSGISSSSRCDDHHNSGCYLTRCAMNLVKCHLPPPLPFQTKKKKAGLTSSSVSHQHPHKVVVAPTSTAVEQTTNEQGPTEDSIVGTSSPSSTSTQVDPLSSSVTTTSSSSSSLPPSLPPPPPSSSTVVVALIDLARMQYWEALVSQVTRRGAKYRDADGLYALHWACAGGPPTVAIEALLQVYPSAVRKTDKEGSTALHFATHYGASCTVIRTVLDAHLHAVTVQDRYGRTPLYHAVEKSAGIDVLKLLVQHNAAAILVPCLPPPPSSRTNKNKEKEKTNQKTKTHPPTLASLENMTRAMAQRTPLYLTWSAVLLDRQTRQTHRGRKWDKALLLLQEAYRHYQSFVAKKSTKQESLLAKENQAYNFSFVTAAVVLDKYLPEDVVHMAVTMHPEQLLVGEKQYRPTGRIPLLEAAAAPMVSRNRSDEIIALLLQVYPQGIRTTDVDRKSALQLAIESGKPWKAGVGRLFHAHPNAITWRDTLGIFPVLAAATTVETLNVVKTDADDVVDEEMNPLGLLSPKYEEIIRRRRLQVFQPAIDEVKITNEEQLSTILDLLRMDPSMITNHLLPAVK